MASRITFGAHTANMSEAGLPSDRHVAYYRERALGGAGMIVVEPMPVHPTAVLTRGNFLVDDDAVVPHFQRLVAACREVGNPIMMQQLYHVGQHGDGDNSFAPNWSPSGLPSYHDADGSHAMTVDEIEETIVAFVSAAERAQRCGFDGVEIFAAYHALIDQFWTPWSNRRSDQWGGSFRNRMRFGEEILRRIRDACGDTFIVGLAVNLDPDSAPSLSVDEMCEIASWHDERRLMDYVTCGTGSYFDFSKLMPTSFFPQQLGVPFASALKKSVKHALVQAESHVRTAAAANEVIGAGHADMVSIVRGQIADPHLVAKARAGRPGDVRPCISCNQLCWGRRSRDYWISCLVNPSAGREYLWEGDRFQASATASTVLVVGGGPAGLETARVAAERGHAVTLVEANDQLGGQWRLAGNQPSRSQIHEHLAWYGRQLTQLGVDVRTSTSVSADDVEDFDADRVVVATGSVPARRGFQRSLPMVDTLPGVGDAVAVHDVLDGSSEPRGTVLVLDDLNDWRGIGTALFLQELGCAVTVVTAAPVVGSGLFHSAADIPARQRFAAEGGVMMPHTIVERWDQRRATMKSVLTGEHLVRAFDHLVIAETPLPVVNLSDELKARGVHVDVVGDAVSARRASQAFYEGRALGRAL